MLAAIVELVARDGYPAVKVGDLASSAGVSRATFYELFENKGDCFLTAHRERSRVLRELIEQALALRDEEIPCVVASRSLVEFAQRDANAFSFLTHEAMLAGGVAFDRRDELISALARLVDRVTPEGERGAADVPARTLLAGVIRVLNIDIRRGELDARELSGALSSWISSYRGPARTRSWESLTAGARLAAAERGPVPWLIAPQPLPRGRHRLPVGLVKRVQRERILHATAAAIASRGYSATTVSNIVEAAGLSREVFYSHFPSRAAAFVATHQLVFEQIMASTAGPFFTSTGAWPGRVYAGTRALLEFVLGAPSLAYVGFVEPYALGPEIAARTDEAMLSFTVFMTERAAGEQSAAPPPTARRAIVAAVMETIAIHLRGDRAHELNGLLPLINYLVLAPSMGSDAAYAFIECKGKNSDGGQDVSIRRPAGGPR